MAIRANIPWVLGDNTYTYTAIAGAGGILRETDIIAAFGDGAVRSLNRSDDGTRGILRRYEIRNRSGRGPRGYAVMFDENFPLAQWVRALARKLADLHPLLIQDNMPKEIPPPPPRRSEDRNARRRRKALV